MVTALGGHGSGTRMRLVKQKPKLIERSVGCPVRPLRGRGVADGIFPFPSVPVAAPSFGVNSESGTKKPEKPRHPHVGCRGSQKSFEDLEDALFLPTHVNDWPVGSPIGLVVYWLCETSVHCFPVGSGECCRLNIGTILNCVCGCQSVLFNPTRLRL